MAPLHLRGAATTSLLANQVPLPEQIEKMWSAVQRSPGKASLLPLAPVYVASLEARGWLNPTAASPPAPSTSPVRPAPKKRVVKVFLRDDEVAILNTVDPDSGKPLARVGVLGEGSCFFHAVLKAVSALYQDNPGLRTEMAHGLRRDFATALASKVSPRGKLLYEVVGGGTLAELGKMQVESDGEDVDYSLQGMVARLNDPDQFVGDEVFQLTAELLDLRLVMLRRDAAGDLEKVAEVTKRPRSDVVFLLGENQHFELLAAPRPDSEGDVHLQALFGWNDVLVKKMAGR